MFPYNKIITNIYVDSIYFIVDTVYIKKGGFMRPIMDLFVLLGLTIIGSLANANGEVKGITSGISAPRYIDLGEGRMAYEDSVSGSETIICIPGMGDTRGQFREIAPLLMAEGFRLIVVDPRGHGDSDATFSKYSASAIGEDLIKLIDSLHTDVYLVGNSSGGASATWAAAERPEKVKAVIFLDAFLRDHPLGFFQRVALELSLRGPWAVAAWTSYYKSLFIGNPPQDQGTYTASLAESLRKDGHIAVLRTMAFSSKSDVEARLKDVHQPVLAIAGSKDPDFPAPEEEVNWILSMVKGEKFMVDGAGHYPHLEQAKPLAFRIGEFVNQHP